IPALSYEETQELAEAGAKVLNAQAVEFAKEKGIAIYARATASPLPGDDPTIDGTVVRRHPPRMPGTVVGVSGERDSLVLHYRPKGHGIAGGDVLLSALIDLRVTGKHLEIGAGRVTMIVPRENLHEEDRVRRTLADRFGDACGLADSLAAVSAVGAGINASFDNVRRGPAALTGAGLTATSVSTSSNRITWTIDRARLDDAVRLLHATFIAND